MKKLFDIAKNQRKQSNVSKMMFIKTCNPHSWP